MNAKKRKYISEGELFFLGRDIFLNVVFGRLKANHEVDFFFFLLIPSSEEQSGFRSEPAPFPNKKSRLGQRYQCSLAYVFLNIYQVPRYHIPYLVMHRTPAIIIVIKTQI